MTAMECLERVRDMQIELRKLERDIKELRAKLYSLKAIDYGKEHISGGTPKDLGDQIAHFNARLKFVQDKWARFVRYSDFVDGMINQIESCQLRALLHERYINGGSWEQVAEVVGVSRQWIDRRMYRLAIREFEKIFKNSLQEFTAVYNECVV